MIVSKGCPTIAAVTPPSIPITEVFESDSVFENPIPLRIYLNFKKIRWNSSQRNGETVKNQKFPRKVRVVLENRQVKFDRARDIKNEQLIIPNNISTQEN